MSKLSKARPSSKLEYMIQPTLRLVTGRLHLLLIAITTRQRFGSHWMPTPKSICMFIVVLIGTTQLKLLKTAQLFHLERPSESPLAIRQSLWCRHLASQHRQELVNSAFKYKESLTTGLTSHSSVSQSSGTTLLSSLLVSRVALGSGHASVVHGTLFAAVELSVSISVLAVKKTGN